VKILILTASPRRDKYIDLLFEDKLKAKGHEVWTRPCLREGRDAVTELRPDVVVVPPIRNPYSRDFCQVMKNWGIGIISRHTEPSCGKKEYEAMNKEEQADIMGRFAYGIDAEIVWGKEEAHILNTRGVPFKVTGVGAIVADLYKSDIQPIQREVLCQKHNLNSEKPIILISSPWGFIDSCPDLHTEVVTDTQRDDLAGRDNYIKMVQELKLDNVLLTLHPGVDEKIYKTALPNIPIDNELPAYDLLKNADVLVHSGSTMAVEMHLLNKPSIQFADVNGAGWWQSSGAVISKVSPKAKNVDHLRDLIQKETKGSNANQRTIKALERGRYGDMDGKAIDRSVEIIDKIEGQFKLTWPYIGRDYSQITIKKRAEDFIRPAACNICKERFFMLQPGFIDDLSKRTKVAKELLAPIHGTSCPHCASRFHVVEP